MEITPNWLDRKFLTKVLEEESNNGPVHILSFSAKPAVAPGNNYLSYMFRVQVEYEAGVPLSHKSVSLMVKVPFVEGFMKEVSEKHNFFAREPKVYSELLPALYKIVFCEFGPKSLYSPVKNVLVMKDLKEEGYLICEKTKQLDYFHCKTVFKKLAKFHAASVACLHDDKELLRDVGQEYFFVKGSSVELMVKPALRNIVKVVNEDERYTVLSDYLSHRVDQIWPSCIKLTKPKTDGGLNVLNHGDLWLNNMMFKYTSSGDILDVKFIDYQLTRLASPVVDLVYFIWTSANEEVREKRQNDLFHIYLTTLNKTLADLGCEERLSVEELREDLLRAVDWAILVISYLIPFMMAGPEDVPDFPNLSEEDYKTERFTKMYKGKNFNKLLPNNILHLSEFFLASKSMLVKDCKR